MDSIHEMRANAFAVLLQDHGTELRARRDAEHLYTAAHVGATGAVAWGVATVGTIPAAANMPWYAHPAFFGALGSVLLAFAVYRKIMRENSIHVELRRQQRNLAALFAAESG